VYKANPSFISCKLNGFSIHRVQGQTIFHLSQRLPMDTAKGCRHRIHTKSQSSLPPHSHGHEVRKFEKRPIQI
jgi:hypothetical protein